MAIPNQTFIEKQLPAIPPGRTHGGGLSYWARGDGAKHTGITYLPKKKVLFFSGGDSNRGVDCDTNATGHGMCFTYSAKDADVAPLNGWTCVGGACRASGQISAVGLDQPPTCYDPKEDCVWVASAKSNDTSNPFYDSRPCNCADHPLGPKPAGSLMQRGVYKVNPNSADQSSWEWTLEIQAGTDPARSYTENMPGWDDGLRYDNVTDKLISLSGSSFRYYAKPLSKTNPQNEEYSVPRNVYGGWHDPDTLGVSSGPMQFDASNNHWALDVVGRWAYFIVAATVWEFGDAIYVDPREVNWFIFWSTYVGGHNWISPTQFTVNNDRTYPDYQVRTFVRVTQAGGYCIGEVISSVYQPGSNTTLVTLQINAGDPQLDPSMSMIELQSPKALNSQRFYRFHLDQHIWQKLPDPGYRPYLPSSHLQGGPFGCRGWSTEVDIHWDSRNRAVIHPDHGLGGPSGHMEGMWVWDTTLKTDSGKIKQYDPALGAWVTVPGSHPTWQYFPVVSTGSLQPEANEHCYDPGENILVLGGGIDSLLYGSLSVMYWWRYK